MKMFENILRDSMSTVSAGLITTIALTFAGSQFPFTTVLAQLILCSMMVTRSKVSANRMREDDITTQYVLTAELFAPCFVYFSVVGVLL